MKPVFQTDYLQIAFLSSLKPTFIVHHEGIFAYGETVNHRNVVQTHEGFVLIFHDRTVNVVIGIRTVENNQRYVRFTARLHDVGERRYVGIETAAHVLQVEQDYITSLCLFLSRFLVFAIQRDHIDACLGVFARGNHCTCLGISPKTMLGRENTLYFYPRSQKCIDKMNFFFFIVKHHRGLIGNYSDLFALDFRQIFCHSLSSANYLIITALQNAVLF